MPVNPEVLRALIQKYGVDKIRSAKDNIDSRREQKMFDRVSERVASQRLPGEVTDAPIVPMEQEIMSYTDAGDPMMMYEAGKMIADGRVLPGMALAGVTLLPAAVAGGAAKKLASRPVERYVPRDRIVNRLSVADEASDKYWGEMSHAYSKARGFISSPKRKEFEVWLDDLAHKKGYLKDGESLPFEQHSDVPTSYSVVRKSDSYGEFDPNTNNVIVRSDRVLEDTPYHEFLHSMRLGNTPDLAYNEFLPDDIKVFSDSYKDATDRYFDYLSGPDADLLSDEYKGLEAAKKSSDVQYDAYSDLFARARDFREDRARALVDFSDYHKSASAARWLDYLSSPEEIAVRPLAVADYLGIKPFSKYPGDEAFDEIYKKAKAYDSAFEDYVHSTPKEKRLLWGAMTGTFLSGAGIGFLKNIPNPEDGTQQVEALNEVHSCGGKLRNMYTGGGSIHIKPSKRGTFTAAATKHGKSVQAFASQVLAHPENYSSAMVRKANFARNAAKWHADGGFLHSYPGGRKRRDYERNLFGKPMDYGGYIDRLRKVFGDDESVKAAILRAKN